MLRAMTLLYNLLHLMHVSMATERPAVVMDNGDSADASGGGSHSLRHNLDIRLTPSNISSLVLESQLYVMINCSMPTAVNLSERFNSSSPSEWHFLVTVQSHHPLVALPHANLDLFPGDNQSDITYMLVQANSKAHFRIHAHTIGETYMSISAYPISPSIDTEDPEQIVYYIEDIVSARPLAAVRYHVTVIRRHRLVDTGFNAMMVVIAMLNSFGMGCVTDWASVRMHLLHPTSLVVVAACQFVIMPVLAGAVAALLLPALGRDVARGLVYVSVVPGGGSGHVMAAVTAADRPLSAAASFVCVLAVIASAPLWVYVTHHLLDAAPAARAGGGGDNVLSQLVHLEVWLAVSAATYLLGLCLRAAAPPAADAYLNWLAKPLLLLLVILLVTLGVYINIYVFHTLSALAVAAAALLPALGYSVGLVAAAACRQDNDYVRTAATETAAHNCVLVIVMLRLGWLGQPAADLSSAVPLVSLLAAPAPFIVAAAVTAVRRRVMRQCEKRKEKKYRTFSVVSSLLTAGGVTHVTSLSSSLAAAPTHGKLDSPPSYGGGGGDEEEEGEDCVFIDEKVTVL